jgi:AraC-like DNA-binding protein
MVEITFMALKALTAAVLGHTPDEAHFAFAGPAPSYADKIRDAFGPHVTFGAAENSMTMPASWLAAQPPFSDPALFQGVLSELRQAVARIENPDNLRARVERLLHTMPDGRLNADSAARAIGVSRRTLVRRLAQTDTRFRDLLDDEMKRRAAKFLQSRTLSRADVAERLGYRDPTSFSRACRRWFKDARAR